MTKNEVVDQVDDLILQMHSRQEQMSLLRKIHFHKNITPVDKLLEDSVSYLRVCVKYLLLDNDCLRRELAEVKKQLGEQ